MWRLGDVALVVWLVGACAGPSRTQLHESQRSEPCPAPTEAVALQAEGYLHRALAAVDRGAAACRARVDWIRAEAAILADLGLDARAIEAYGRLSDTGDDAAAEARAAIAELGERPPHVRDDVSAEDRATALAMYRDGVNRRLDGDFDGSLRKLRTSYALSPHPLTIVQIGLTHAAAGDEVESRKANARALAIAELVAGVPAMPRIRAGHTGPILTAEIGATARRVATAGVDGSVRVWDTTTARISHGFDLGAAVNLAAFDGAAARLVAVSTDGRMSVVDVATGQPVSEMDVSALEPTIAILSVDGDRVFAGAYDGTVVAFDAATGHELWRSSAGRSSISALAASPDGALVAAGSHGGVVQVFTSDAGAAERSPGAHGGAVTGIAFGPDGDRVATVGADRVLRVSRVPGASVVFEHTLDRTGHSRVAFSPDGAEIAVGGVAPGVSLHAAATGEQRARLRAGTAINGVRYGPAGARLAVIGHESVELWDVAARTRAGELERPTSRITALALSPDGNALAAAAERAAIALWDLNGGDHRRLLTPGRSFSLAFSPDSARVAAIDHRGDAVWWSVATGEAMVRDTIESPELAYVDPTGEIIADLSWQGELRVSDAGDGAQRYTAALPQTPVYAAAFSPDGNALAVAAGGRAVIWDVGAASVARAFGDGDDVVAVAYSPDGRVLATGGMTGAAALWDPRTGERLATVAAHELDVTAVAFRPDGAALATAGGDHDVKLWSVPDLEAIATYRGHTAWMHAVVFDPADRFGASAGLDGVVRLWEPATLAERAALVMSNDGEWLIVAGDEVDGSDPDTGGPSLLYWQCGPFQLPGFVGWQRQYRPDLLLSSLGTGG